MKTEYENITANQLIQFLNQVRIIRTTLSKFEFVNNQGFLSQDRITFSEECAVSRSYDSKELEKLLQTLIVNCPQYLRKHVPNLAKPYLEGSESTIVAKSFNLTLSKPYELQTMRDFSRLAEHNSSIPVCLNSNVSATVSYYLKTKRPVEDIVNDGFSSYSVKYGGPGYSLSTLRMIEVHSPSGSEPFKVYLFDEYERLNNHRPQKIESYVNSVIESFNKINKNVLCAMEEVLQNKKPC